VDADNATGLVVGTGDYSYDVFRPWGVLPAGWTFGLISHVAVDSRDRVYFTMYSADGRMLARGRPVTIGAHGVWGDSQGNLYVAEVGVHRVTKLARRPPTARA
jgi:hypothetical protein